MIDYIRPVRRVGGWAETFQAVANQAGQWAVAREQRKALRAGAGAEAIASMAAKPTPFVPDPRPELAGQPRWMLPAVIGGGVLALVLILKR